MSIMKRVPSQRIYKVADIYVCVACDGMYTIDMIDIHLAKCSMMPEWEEKNRQEEESMEEEAMDFESIDEEEDDE